MPTITLTYAECVENHVGNAQEGQKLETGMSVADLQLTAKSIASWAAARRLAVECQLYDFGAHCPESQLDAGVLVIRNLRAHTHEEGAALAALPWDAKYYDTRRKTVLNKNARWNLCFTDTPRQAAYETGQGTVFGFHQLPPFMSNLRDMFSRTIHISGRPYSGPQLFAEGNYYYDTSKCYIGWHGDVERSLVAGYRLGEAFPLHFWVFGSDGQPHVDVNGKELVSTINLQSGDGYVMSKGATGWNWRRKQFHLRHAAGFPSVLKKTQTRAPVAW